MKKKKKGLSAGTRAVLIILCIISACVLAFCAYKIIGIQKGYRQAQNYYTDMEKMISGNTMAEEEEEEINAKEKYTYRRSPILEDNRILSPMMPKRASVEWDYDAFYKICEDAEGYIYQEGTMSYPVVQAEDNTKYLRNLIDGTYNVAGTIFVDSNFKDGLEGRYCIMYGHNMDDKSMFGSITSYKDKKYYKKHPYFEIYTKEGQYAYYVYAVAQVPIYDDIYSFAVTDEEFMEIMDHIKEIRAYKPDIDLKVTEKSHVVVLSTCIDYPRDYGYRYVVVLVRGEPLLPKE